MKRRIALVGAIASGWLAALLVYILDGHEIDAAAEAAYAEGLADCDDAPAQRGGA